MTKRAALTVFTLYTVAGFFVGLALGRNVRDKASENTKTSYSNGKILIEVDAKKTMTEAINDLI